MSTEPQNLSHEMILRAYKALHLSRTLYKSALFMQNKPNLPDAQMNINSLLTKDYENVPLRRRGENKPNTNPIKPNLRKAEMNLNFYLTKDYENERLRRCGENKPNQTQSPAGS